MNILAQITIAGLLFIFTIVTGVWLSNSGKPLNVIIFNIHKLIAPVSVVLTIFIIRKLLKNVEMNAIILILIIGAVFLVLALFVSGALLSVGKMVNNFILTTHRVTTILTVIAGALTIYFLLSKE